MKQIDMEKIKRIEKILKQNPRGLWIREISRKTGIDKSTVSIYLRKHIRLEVETKKMGNLKLASIKK